MSVVSTDDQVAVEEKYVVKKANGEILAPGTYFVIKESDLFAVSGLWSYAHALATVMDLADSRPLLTPEEYDRLRDTQDTVSRLAAIWQQAKSRKLPD
jgi:hypothetical protein